LIPKLKESSNKYEGKGLEFQYDTKWGLDHGAFIALGGIFPNGIPENKPVFMISVNSSFNMDEHAILGLSIADFID